VKLAVQYKADGVHFMAASVELVREAKGANLQIGLSIKNIEHIKEFEKYVDYFSMGPIFHSQTYPNITSKGLKPLRTASLYTKKPIYAAGGIRSEHLKDILESGAVGIVKRVRAEEDWAAAPKNLIKSNQICLDLQFPR
jgi:thiamine-phosphate pyrophosphorylase